MIVRTWRKDSGERLPPLGGSEQHVHVLTLLVMSVGRAVGLTKFSQWLKAGRQAAEPLVMTRIAQSTGYRASFCETPCGDHRVRY